MSSSRSWLSSAKRPSVRDRVLLAGAAGELLRGVGALGDVARDDEQGLDGPVAGADGHRLDGERQTLAGELEGAPLTLQRGAVVLEAELEDVVGHLGVQLGHLASAEHVLAEEPRRLIASPSATRTRSS